MERERDWVKAKEGEGAKTGNEREGQIEYKTYINIYAYATEGDREKR